MKGYVGALAEPTLKNTCRGQMLFTARQSHLVMMCLQPGEEIGDDVHAPSPAVGLHPMEPSAPLA